MGILILIIANILTFGPVIIARKQANQHTNICFIVPQIYMFMTALK